jgi:cytochrome c oxidase subunit 4
MSDTELRDLDEALPSEPDETAGHGGSDKLYIQIFVLLVVITAAEVSTYVVDFGDLMLPSLILMMVVKFVLVIMFFMHLKFDNKLFTWVFVSGLVLAVLVYIAAITTFEYWQDL